MFGKELLSSAAITRTDGHAGPGEGVMASHSYTAAFRVREYYHTTTGSATVLLLPWSVHSLAV